MLNGTVTATATEPAMGTLTSILMRRGACVTPAISMGRVTSTGTGTPGIPDTPMPAATEKPITPTMAAIATVRGIAGMPMDLPNTAADIMDTMGIVTVTRRTVRSTIAFGIRFD